MLQVIKAVKLFKQPDKDAEKGTLRIEPGFAIEKIGQPADAPDWWEVSATLGTEKSDRGFLPQEMVRVRPELSPPTDETINVKAFMTQLTIQARVQHVNRDLLAAIAVAESGMRNIKTGAHGGTAFGPFQFIEKTWAGLVTQNGAKYGITLADRFNPIAQAVFAAIATATAAKELEKVLKIDGPEGTRLASGPELYFAHFVGWPAACKILPLEREIPIRDALAQAGEDAEAIISMNAGLVGDGSIPVNAVLNEMEGRLIRALGKVAQMTAELPQHLRFVPKTQGEPPWLAKAREFDGVKEVEGEGQGQSNPQIEKFHASTSMGSAPDDVPWCASFVNFCMKNSGNDKVARSALNSATAADWREWGEVSLTEPVLGALVILRPQAPRSSGHVSFFIREEGDNVILFGGNQKNMVCESAYGKAEVVGMRWLNWTPPGNVAGATVTPADFAISDRAAEYIVGKESFVGFRYQDVSDHATIGYGHHKGLSSAEIDAQFPDGLTEEEAWALMLKDADEFAGVVRRAITVDLAQHRVDALIQVAFATGNVNSEKAAVNAGDHAKAADIIRSSHNTTGGAFHAGLAARFGDIADLYLNGIYPTPAHSRAELKAMGIAEIKRRFPDKLNHLGNNFGRPPAESQKRQARAALLRMTGEQLP